MMLHARELAIMETCPRLAWINRMRQERPAPYYRFEPPFSQTWAQAWNLEDTPCGKTGDSLAETLAMMETSDKVRFARFTYGELRCTIPLIEKEGDGWKLVFACRTGLPRESEALYMEICRQIVERAGIQVTGQEIIHMNRFYMREGNLDPAALFMRTDRLYNRKRRAVHTIGELQADLDVDLDWLVEEAEILFSGEIPEAVHCPGCHMGKRCQHYDACFETEAWADTDARFLKGMQAEGSMAELEVPEKEGITRSQILAARNGGVHQEPELLQEWMDRIEYPLCYLDFEWDSFGFPPYDGMHPLDVLCFQYSMHVEKEDGTLSHTSFFASGDCRKEFVESLLSSVPETGTILVYNQKGGEELRLQQLAQQFPEYEEALTGLCARMMDLSDPFEKGWYHDLRMRGRFSLKNVLPVFHDGPGYGSLSIQNGMEAVHAYRAHETASEAEKEEIANRISTYCAMDTYAEYLVFHGLKERMK